MPATDVLDVDAEPDVLTLPSSDSFRFRLLLVAVTGATLFIGNLLFLTVPARSWSLRQLRCLQQLPAIPLIADAATFRMECAAAYDRSRVIWEISELLLVGAVALGIWWFLPAWRVRRSQLEPLAGEDAPELLAELYRLASIHVPGQQLSFVWNPLDPTVGGLAFGRWRRSKVALTGGLVATFATDPSTFRAVVLHEFAHLRNRDVNRTYLSIALWRAFMLFAIVPYLLAVALRGEWNQLNLGVAWRLLVLTALVLLVRSAILRSREHYADLRAQGADAVTLHRLLRAPNQHRSWYQRLFDLHPGASARRRVLDDPSRLLRIGFLEAFGAALAGAVALTTLGDLIGAITHGAADAKLWTGVLVAPLLVGVVGLGVWRMGTSAAVRGRRPGSILRPALGLGLGLVVGPLVGVDGAGQPDPAGLAGLGRSGMPALTAWGCLAVLGAGVFLAWVAAVARGQAAASATADRWRLTVAGLAVAGGVLALWIGVLLSIREAVMAIGPAWDGLANPHVVTGLLAASFVTAAERPLTLAVTVVTWALPLAVRHWHPRAARAAARQAGQPRFRLVVGAGLAGGLAFTALLTLLQLYLHRTVPTAAWDRYTYGRFYYEAVAMAAVFQAVVAVAFAVRGRVLGWAYGLASAWTLALVAATGLHMLGRLSGCFAALELVAGADCGVTLLPRPEGLALVATAGSLLAAPAVAVASAITRRVGGSASRRTAPRRLSAAPVMATVGLAMLVAPAVLVPRDVQVQALAAGHGKRAAGQTATEPIAPVPDLVALRFVPIPGLQLTFDLATVDHRVSRAPERLRTALEDHGFRRGSLQAWLAADPPITEAGIEVLEFHDVAGAIHAMRNLTVLADGAAARFVRVASIPDAVGFSYTEQRASPALYISGVAFRRDARVFRVIVASHSPTSPQRVLAVAHAQAAVA